MPDPPGGDGGPGLRLVIEGNKAWDAAAEVRRRWLRTLLARRTAPREVLPFLARQVLTMPEPLRTSLGTAYGNDAVRGAGASDEMTRDVALLLLTEPQSLRHHLDRVLRISDPHSLHSVGGTESISLVCDLHLGRADLVNLRGGLSAWTTERSAPTRAVPP